MNIIISGHQIQLTPAIKRYIEYKAQHKLSAFEDRIHKISIVLEKEHFNFKCDCSLTSDFGEFYASDHEETQESSIDRAIDKIVHEIKKKHDKIVKHTHKQNI